MGLRPNPPSDPAPHPQRPSWQTRLVEVIFGGIAIVTAGLGLIVAVGLGLLSGDLGILSWPKNTNKWVKAAAVLFVFAVLVLLAYLLIR